MSKNIVYQSDEILDFYSSHRQAWDEFYPSEKWVFERLAGRQKELGDVLDVGCAGGGLGAALCGQFKLKSYMGIDIHQGIIDWAKDHRKLNVPTEFVADDISTVTLDKQFDMVVSLGCADWNIETRNIIQSCWSKVKPGGYFTVSLRLTTDKTINDMAKSYQKINFSGKDDKPELANYVVINHKEAIDLMRGLNPQPGLIGSYGYWGKPSGTAVTPFSKILFTVFYLQKMKTKQNRIDLEINWPDDVPTEGI